MENQTKKITRREFMGLSALGLTSLTILPSWVVGGVRVAPSDRITAGFIGLGRQGVNNFHSLSQCPGVQIAAGCDVDSIKRERFVKITTEWQKANRMTEKCDQYESYEQMLERDDIDAIVISTPDHWHALTAIHSLQAGKDVYCEKPLTYTISESLAVVRAVRNNQRVLQVGSQQRSSKEFQTAIKMVREGAIGYVGQIHVRIGEPPAPFNLPEEPVPANLNFDRWLGPLNSPVVHYNPAMCPPIAWPDLEEKGDWAVWRYYRETGNGFTGDWGAHHFDIAQAAIGMDGLGPVEFIPAGYNGAKWATMKYANGQVMTEQPFREDRPDAKGINFIGTDGWIKVARGYIECSEPTLIAKTEQTISGQKVGVGTYETSSPHMQDFIDSVRSRKEPIAPVEAGCSTNIICCLLNIAYELGRPVKWDPVTLTFVDDAQAQAHRLYWYEYRNPYVLPYWKKSGNI
jgi:predicted dehydrogenase